MLRKMGRAGSAHDTPMFLRLALGDDDVSETIERGRMATSSRHPPPSAQAASIIGILAAIINMHHKQKSPAY